MQATISSIIVPFERIREDVGDILELADSIRRLGLLHPLVVDDQLRLISGYRRFVAVQALGWSYVEIKKLGELTQIERHTIELEENIRRKQLTWQEEAKAKAELHRLLLAEHGQRGEGAAGHATVQGVNSPGWSLRDTAQMLGESLGKVSEDIALAGYVDDPTVGNRKSRIEAIRTMRRVREIETLKVAADELRQSTAPGDFAWGAIRNGDSRLLLAELADDSVDLLLTDPPFGIGVDHSRWAHELPSQLYSDTDSDANRAVVHEVMRASFRVLKPGHYGFMFCAAQDTGYWAGALTAIGYSVMPKPLIWCKGRGSLTDFQTQFGSAYETFICCWKPDGTDNLIDRRPLSKPLADVFHYPRPTSTWHPFERPIAMLSELIETSTVGGNLVLDPFAGGGSTLAAAYMTARRFYGIELDAGSWTKACQRMTRLEAGVLDDDRSADPDSTAVLEGDQAHDRVSSTTEEGTK